MAWSLQFSNRYFSNSSYQKGSAYYRRGAVRLIHGTDRAVEATVQGTSRYNVFIDIQSNSFRVRCSCLWFEDTGAVCKHIWATMLAADAEGYIKAAEELRNPAIKGVRQDFLFDIEGEPAPVQPKPPEWRRSLALVHRPTPSLPVRESVERQWCYLIDLARSWTAGNIILRIVARKRKKNGEWGKLALYENNVNQVDSIADPQDRQILTMIGGAREEYSYSLRPDSIRSSHRIPTGLDVLLIPELCKTGRCFLLLPSNELDPHNLAWDDGPPWELGIEVEKKAADDQYVLEGVIRRVDQSMPVSQAVLATPNIVLFGNTFAQLDSGNGYSWISMLRQKGPITVSEAQKYDFAAELFNIGNVPRLKLPPELHPEKANLSSPPLLRVHSSNRPWTDHLECEVTFTYPNAAVPDGFLNVLLPSPSQRLLLRDLESERAELSKLTPLGFVRMPTGYGHFVWELPSKRLPAAVRVLSQSGWRIEADGKLYRRGGAIRVEVKTGVDWFELEGAADFEGKTAKLPDILKAIKRGETMVQLDDGSMGLLPEEWLTRYGMTAALATSDHESIRFSRGQAGLLDALLATQPDVDFDAGFTRIRQQLLRFEGIAAADPKSSFVGELREYQRDGLGWLQFLRQFGFGGCLADDMGLGKTVQVLALLDTLRKSSRKPSLLVAPKSLVFNWKEEAARFTPKLRVLDHTGGTRIKASEHFENFDAVLTTYGTMRRDILLLKEVSFDTIVLDEAQAIKNAGTDAAKAARLLQGDHKLALTGTPVQNHLGELWSLFEFLNPGLLGTSTAFNSGLGESSGSSQEVLRRALRPFILRRTKDQVAKDLPPKLEQTIYCEMEKEQKKIYDDLRNYYRQSLLAKIDSEGIQKSKMHVLEALLRLRQAACHPALIDALKATPSSAKLDALIPQLMEVIDEGHKALVFSQFTSFLKIVRGNLDREGIVYEYLDGQTRDRASRVARFQEDSKCPLFLISLKAGGLGLNLTAADYVFLLDPWWNPAVEAQAIDRTHRIGQTRRVFAYRLITKGTVEERVLELQQTKRELADAIIGAENSVLRGLTREHLELLLS